MAASSTGAGVHQRSSSLRGYFHCVALEGDTLMANRVVTDCVLWATGSAVDGRTGGVVCVFGTPQGGL